jgi:hypothetical protein
LTSLREVVAGVLFGVGASVGCGVFDFSSLTEVAGVLVGVIVGSFEGAVGSGVYGLTSLREVVAGVLFGEGASEGCGVYGLPLAEVVAGVLVGVIICSSEGVVGFGVVELPPLAGVVAGVLVGV